MTRASIDAPATHFRLEPETWALAIEDYRNGATAKEVGAKWMVAPSSVYRRATAAGTGKRAVGDARARAHARRVEEEEAGSRGAKGAVGTRALGTLFAPSPVGDPEASDPAALARVASLASGRGMRGRLWTEAKSLVALAESYQRMAGQEAARSAGVTETLPLRSVLDVRLASDERIAARFHVSDRPGVKDPDRDLKDAYWSHMRMLGQVEAMKQTYVEDLKTHVARLETLMRRAAMTPPEMVLRKTTLTF